MGLALGCSSSDGGADTDSSGISASGETGNSSSADTNTNTNSNGDGDAGDGDSGDGDSGDGDGDPGDGDGDSGDGGTGSNQKFDTLTVPDAAFNCGSGGNDDPEFSYLWAANSSQGTITKIDTKTVTEVGRYQVRPDGAGSPSRTSVSLSGDVAVASRSGGVTKIYANEESCQESNGMPGIQTSNSNQALPWGTEECVAWHKPMQYASQRPVAWGAGEFNEGTCYWEDEELWTAATQGQTIDVYVLDGEDGSTKEMITLQGVAASYYGIYGGAVDGNGDFWGSQLGAGKLVRVNRADMTYDIWQMPVSGYGMTVDSEGYVWTCSSSVARFDPMTETWQTAAVGGYTGCMADAGEDGLLWVSQGGNGVMGINRDTLMVEKQWAAGGSYGISIDFEGYVWAVANGSTASKIDPETGQFWTYNGLVGAYTYSDMTGYALTNVGSPSG
ncbi:Alkaline phosphatase [Enhygromyxa salina]|uniref:Alkaline phosphatase n=1 Tax=Enhygromyxa salina TaxID=215803 RepID=A0A0C1ZGW6_9BACT|nr:Alkaline phosphatase [Enhygromyxa salina]